MNVFGLLSTAYSNIVPFVLLLSILVFVHEYGHFIVARWCGVRVEVFSLGFGKKILSYKRGDTTYCLSLIPFGGYVKMFGEQGGDFVPENERAFSFTHKKVWQRILIVLAGPLMNLFFATLVFSGIAYFGEETRAARIADVQIGSVAEQAGLKFNDKIISVNGANVRSYEEFQNRLNLNKDSEVTIRVQQENQEERSVKVNVTSAQNPNVFSTESTIGQISGLLPFAKGTLLAITPDSLAFKNGLRTGDEIIKIDSSKVKSWSDLNVLLDGKTHEIVLSSNKIINIKDLNSQKTLQEIGIEDPDLYLEQVVPGSPADKAEFLKYDKIISINGEPILNWEMVLNKIKSYDGKEALTVVLSRDGVQLTKKVTPQVTSQMTAQGKEDRRYTIGIVPMTNLTNPEIVKIAEDSIFKSIGRGIKKSYDISAMTLISFVRMFQGEVSHKNIGGMISIGKVAKDSYAMGVQPFMITMGILSISLFILNLLPIPVLDGGHLVFYIIELLKGSPLSLKKVELAHRIGFGLLMALMVLALFNDFTKFLLKS